MIEEHGRDWGKPIEPAAAKARREVRGERRETETARCMTGVDTCDPTLDVTAEAG